MAHSRYLATFRSCWSPCISRTSPPLPTPRGSTFPASRSHHYRTFIARWPLVVRFQWLGHPIANDPCYGGELFFGDPDAKRRVEQDPATRGWRGARNQLKRTQEGGVDGVVREGARVVAGSDSDAAIGGDKQHVLPTQSSTGGDGSLSPSPRASGCAEDVQGGGGQSAARDAPSTEHLVRLGETGDTTVETSLTLKPEPDEPAVGSESGGQGERQRDGEDDEAFMVRRIIVAYRVPQSRPPPVLRLPCELIPQALDVAAGCMIPGCHAIVAFRVSFGACVVAGPLNPYQAGILTLTIHRSIPGIQSIDPTRVSKDMDLAALCGCELLGQTICC